VDDPLPKEFLRARTLLSIPAYKPAAQADSFTLAPIMSILTLSAFIANHHTYKVASCHALILVASST
jgi:hypothetical protein